MASEHNFAVALQWICFGLSFFSFGFYTYKVRAGCAPLEAHGGSPLPGLRRLGAFYITASRKLSPKKRSKGDVRHK